MWSPALLLLLLLLLHALTGMTVWTGVTWMYLHIALVLLVLLLLLLLLLLLRLLPNGLSTGIFAGGAARPPPPARPSGQPNLNCLRPLCLQPDVVLLKAEPSSRPAMWHTKRIFFCTPQLLQNDLASKIAPADRLVSADCAVRATP